MKTIVLVCSLLFAALLAQAKTNEVLLSEATAKTIWLTSVYSYGYAERIRDMHVGGWCDFYESFLKWESEVMPTNATKAVLRLYAKQIAESDGVKMKLTDVEVRTIHDSCPGPDESSNVFSPLKMATYGMRPTSSHLATVKVSKEGWVEINITDLYRKLMTGTKNEGLHFVPLNNQHTRTVFAGLYDKDGHQPQLIFTVP